jgi:hypothetical protein
MRAYLIDGDQRSITEIDFIGDYKAMQRAIGCDEFTSGAFLNGSISEGFDDVLVSDDYLEDEDDPKGWFQIDADRDPPSSFPIAGKGLVIGADKMGESCGARISLEELTSRVTFTRRKFRGFEVKTGGVFDLEVTMKAPIVDEKKGG